MNDGAKRSAQKNHSLARHAGLVQTLLATRHPDQVVVHGVRSMPLPPEATKAFATAHDDAVLACLDMLLSSGAPGYTLACHCSGPACPASWGLGTSPCGTACTGRFLVFLSRCAACHIASRDPAFACALVDAIEGGLASARSPTVAPPHLCFLPGVPPELLASCWRHRRASA